ncbi:hypothetical protein ATCC90586_010278 [Pythium insidiosum]|nr:hypothetical protein ATCC90586_010278 [Pythium insidiosum]
MWAFAVVACALASPAVRAWLEALFAELVVVFVNRLGVVFAVTLVSFIAAVVVESSGWTRRCSASRSTSSPSPRLAHRLSSRRGGASFWALTSAAALAVVNASSSSSSSSSAATASVGARIPFTLADNETALSIIRQNLTMCPYSKKKECVANPASVAALGEYKRGPGRCVAMDTAYVDGLTNPDAALPNRYLPIAVEDAYAKGFRNRYSEWSKANREQFKIDCPLLYNRSVARGQDLLCCTENQYEALQTQVRMLSGSCSSCTDNLRDVWCQLTCDSSNSQFLEVSQVRVLQGDAEHADAVFPAIEELTYFVSRDWIRDIYDFCLGDRFFNFICSAARNCTDGYGLLQFMGAYKFNTRGSPLQVNVRTMDEYDEAQQRAKFCACGSNATDCFQPSDAKLRSCVGVCGSVCRVSRTAKRSYSADCVGAEKQGDNDPRVAPVDAKWTAFMSFMASNLERADFTALNVLLGVTGGLVTVALLGGFVYSVRYGRRAGSIAATRSPPSRAERRLSYVDDVLTELLKRWAFFLATGNRPYVVLACALAAGAACSAGLSQLQVETDPVKLWVAETSRAFKERDRYAELFMPFYRTEQVLMVPKDKGTIGRREFLREAIRIQERISATVFGASDAAFPERVALDDICWKATGTACTVNAITQYIQNRLDHFDFYDKYGLAMKHFEACLYSPEVSDIQTCAELQAQLKPGDKVPPAMADCPCLASFGAPMNLYNTILGGYPEGAELDTKLFLQAKAMVVTALVYNYYELERNEPAINWERELVDKLREEAASSQLFDLYFMTESSVQDEIDRSSKGDLLPIAMSYALMIVYVSLGTSHWPWAFSRSFFRTSKVSVGFLGVVTILLAVASTIGIFMWCGAKLQLVIMEVVPFLTLAIGVDNIFLLVHAVARAETRLRADQPTLFDGVLGDPAAAERAAAAVVAEAVGFIGPSILMASFAESVAFAFGCISPMPAVLWFAAFSAVAVVVNWLLQMTVLLVIITLDKRRELVGKYDLLCCVTSAGVELKTPRDPGTRDSAVESHAQRASSRGSAWIDRYADWLANRVVKLVVLLGFSSWTILSIVSIQGIDHGLQQAESMPSGSYLIDYFNKIDEYLATGPPIYFVVEGGFGRNPAVFDLNDPAVQAKFCKSKDFCEEFAVPKIVDALANELDSAVTHFSKGATYSWLDDLWGFVNPNNDCCRVERSTGAYIPINAQNQTYTTWRNSNPTCLPSQAAVPPLPNESFMSLFSMFSTASAGAVCSFGGGSIYRGQFSVDDKPIPILDASSPQVVLNSTGYGAQVSAFSYMVISTANSKQQDFIDAYAQARRAAEWISEQSGVDVWTYSLTYVYFEQYLTVVRDTYTLVGLALAAIFVIHAVYFGGVAYALVVALTCANVVVLVMGLMPPNDIMLNGLSMVNLIIAAGASVEFGGHFVRMFAKAGGTGDQRAKQALRKVLASVLFGIPITKVIGLSMLMLADSRIFQKYYFRMYMALVVSGILNGLVLLPVLLSVCVDVQRLLARGRQGGKEEEEDQALDAAASPAFLAMGPAESAK